MSEKSNIGNVVYNIPEDSVIPRDIEQEMRRAFIEYSMSVIIDRALPDVRDGLKPVHRRILYSMYTLGFTPDKAYRKCATTVGDVLGKYHPHGDAAVYDAVYTLYKTNYSKFTLTDLLRVMSGDEKVRFYCTKSRIQKKKSAKMHLKLW